MLSLSEIWALPAFKEVSLLLLGALVSTVAKELPMFLRNHKRVTPLLGGPWHAYHWSRSQGHSIFRHTQFQCRRSLYGVVIDATNAEGAKSFYRGRVSFEGSDVLFEFHGRNHTESFQVRMNEPIEHDRITMVGVFLGMDYDRVKFSAVQICLRNEVSDEEAMRLIRDVTELDSSESSLRVVRPGDRARLSRQPGGPSPLSPAHDAQRLAAPGGVVPRHGQGQPVLVPTKASHLPKYPAVRGLRKKAGPGKVSTKGAAFVGWGTG